MRSPRYLCCLLPSLLFIACSTPEEQALEALTAGTEALVLGDRDLAVEHYTKATELDPASVEAWARLSRAQLDGEFWHAAREAAQKAAILEPSSPDHQETIGRSSVALEAWDEARSAFEKALALDPERHQLSYELAKVQEQLEDREGALKSYRSAIKGGAEPLHSRLALARLLLDQSETEEVEPLLAMARELSDNDEVARAEYDQLKARYDSLTRENRYGILSALRQGNAPTSPFGRDSALGNDLENALGGLMGNQIRENFGIGGLGLRGIGHGGGGTGEGTIGLGSRSNIGHSGGGGSGSGYGRGGGLGRLSGISGSSPRVNMGAMTVSGGTPEIPRRYIRRHINQIRFCYEQGLQRTPTLSGRVTLRIRSQGSGSGTSASIQSSTLGDEQVESCLTRATGRIAFPEPDSGSTWDIVVPFTFSPPENLTAPRHEQGSSAP